MNNLLVNISEKIRKQIQLYVNIATGEISWIGEVSMSGNILTVKEIFLIEQDTTLDRTILNDDAYAEFIMEYVKRGGNPANLKLWLHSHGDGSVFWSPDDEKTIENHNRADFFLSIVTNKFGDILARVDIFKPLRVKVDNIRIFTPTDFDPRLVEKANREVADLVHYHIPPPVNLIQFSSLEVQQ